MGNLFSVNEHTLWLEITGIAQIAGKLLIADVANYTV